MENNESFASPKEETPASKAKPDFEKMAEEYAPLPDINNPNHGWASDAQDAFMDGCHKIWNDHVEPAKAWSEKQNAFIEKLSQENESQREQIAALQEERDRLKIELSNYAYQMDMAKRERDHAENKNLALQEEIEMLKQDRAEKIESIVFAKEEYLKLQDEIEQLKNTEINKTVCRNCGGKIDETLDRSVCTECGYKS